MVNITKVYTKTGDRGDTQVAAGVSISKGSQRIEVIGGIDELNASIGLCVSQIREDSDFEWLLQSALRIQNELFNLGSQLAVLAVHRRENTPLITDEATTKLESEIDMINADLPRLSSFILPGGTEAASRFHFSRTICRRVERTLVTLKDEVDDFEPVTLIFLNRLSDWLFVMARYCNFIKNYPETLWK